MKLLVVTDAKGKVIGTARVERQTAGKGEAKDTPFLGQPATIRGQEIHEIDIPSELQKVEDVEEFHKTVKKHLSQSQAKK